MNIVKIYKSGKTVFRIKDLLKIFDTNNPQTVRNFLSKQKKQGKIKNISYGLWGLPDYNPYELACKYRRPSYISFQTVLKKQGIIFQNYLKNIYIASSNSLEKKIDTHNLSYHKLKDDILLNPKGIISKGTYMEANIPRAICDMIYISQGFYFDNLSGVDLDRLKDIASIYNKRTFLEVKNIIKDVKSKKA